MQTARELAALAIRIASGLSAADVKGFHWRHTAASNVHLVMIELEDGTTKRYLVHEVQEEGGDSFGASS